MKYKKWGIFAALAGAVLTLAVLLVFIVSGGIIPQSMLSSAANASKPLQDLFYIKNGTLYYTSLDTIAPEEIVQYELPPQQRDVFSIRASEDGKRFFYPDKIDNTKLNYCADIYCYDMTSKKPERKMIDSGINNYTTNQNGSKVFYLKDKSLYLSNLSKTKKIAAEIDKFFINKEGDRLVYLTSDGRLFHYTGKKEPEELVSGIKLQYVSSDLNTIYYLKANDLYLLKDGKDVRMIDSGVASVSNIYADGSLYYLKDEYIKTKSLYYYSNGQSAKISEYCDNVWRDEDHDVLYAIDSGVSFCGNDRPFLVYSQLKSDKINMSDVADPADNVDIYACSGSKVLGKIGAEKPIRVEYDTVNNKIYYALNHSEKQFLYDLYCVATDGETTIKVSKYAEDVTTIDILFGGNVVYIKSESNFSDGDLYVNNAKIDSFSNIWNWWTNSPNAFTYAGNISRYDDSFALKLYQDGKVTKLADHVAFYMSYHYGNKLAYVIWKNRNETTGQLYLYDGSEASQLIDTKVNAIITPLENQYYSYWDDRPTYDLE